MKLLFVNFSKTWGGGEFWHYQQVLELAQRGYEVTILTNKGSPLSRKLKQTRVSCVSLPITNRSFINPVKLIWMYLFIRKLHPECIILNGPNDLKFSTLVSKINGVPKIIYRRGNAERVKPHLSNRWLFRHITHLLVNSEGILLQLRDDFGKHLPAVVQTIHNGIHFPDTPVSIDYTVQRIAILGRLSREKGVDLALTAFQVVCRELSHTRLVVIGDGKERVNLEDLAKALGISNNVEFLGFREDYREILAGCSHLVIPSRWEGFSFAKLEAMRLKLPVIAFEIPGLKEACLEHSVIRFASPFDTDALATAILDLLHSPEESRSLGETGFAHARKHFHLPALVSQLEELLRSP